MGKTIWRFPVDLHTPQPTLMMPVGAEILTLQLNRGQMTIWAVVDADGSQEEERQFRLLPTGSTVSDKEYAKLKYIGTWQPEDIEARAGVPMVVHVFEEDTKE